ncbi:MAG: hypothetical protein ACNA8H_03330 [Anaerolineales bacterium]
MSERSNRLTNGMDEHQREFLGELTSLESFLDRYPAPEPSLEQNADLVARLKAHLPGNQVNARQEESAPVYEDRSNLSKLLGATDQPLSISAASVQGLRNWLRLSWSQTVLFEKPFWWACAAVFAVGLVIVSLSGDGWPVLFFLGLAPLLAAAGVAYAFRPDTQTLWELEKISPISTMELLYSRLGLVLAINTAISLVLLGIVWGQGLQLVLWRILLAWLGPMLALAGCALYISIRWGSLAGVAAPLILWGIVNFLGWQQAVKQATEAPLAALWLVAQVNQSNLLMGFFLLAIALGLVLVQRAGDLASRGDLGWR